MIVKYSLTGIVVLVVCLLSLNLADGADEIENRVEGGDFEDNLELGEWRLAKGAAAGTMTIDNEESAVGKASLFVEVTGLDPAKPWMPYPIQLPIKDIAENGETYTISAFFKAEEERSIQMVVFFEPPYVVHFSKDILVGTEWEEYWGTFTVSVDTALGVKFLNKSLTFNYWMDGVRFYEGEYKPTEIGGPQIAVDPRSKLSTTWATLKRH